MARIDFYHLTASPIEKVLPSIAGRLVAQGQRLLIVGPSEQVATLDRQLWTYAAESFLPHAPRGKLDDGDQPILLSDAVTPANHARNVAIADGQWRDEALAFDRIFFFFDAAALDGARAAWRGLKERSKAERHYWKQDERGRWAEAQ